MQTLYDLNLTDAHIFRFNGYSFSRQEFVLKKEENSFKVDIDFLNLEKGINPESAVLRVKKRANEEEKYGFWLGVLPVSKENVVLKVTLTISTGGAEIFKCSI